MPWTVKDVDKHKKGLTPAQKKKWVSIANSVLKDCQKKGGSGCEGKAIRIANSKFVKSSTGRLVMEKEVTKKIPKGALRFVADNCDACVFAEGEGDAPKLKMLAYSGGVIKGHWYWGDLAIDVSGLSFPSRFPILEDHRTDKKIAFIFILTGKLSSCRGVRLRSLSRRIEP